MTTFDVKDWDILVVDDEPDNLTMLEVLLNFYDAQVTTARSGEQALNLLRDHVYRLALIDIQMPKISGWDVVKYVREHQNPALQNMPLIAVTALAMPGDKERVLECGFDGYISKPIDAATFIPAVAMILNEPAKHRSVPLTLKSTTDDDAQLTVTIPDTKPLTAISVDTLQTEPKTHSDIEKAS